MTETDLKALTAALCSLPGPSGAEGPVFDYIADYVRPLADEVRTDPLGNLIAVKRCGLPGAQSLLIDAHMDEIGLIVTSVEDGFLRFAPIGGVDPRLLPASEVRILCEPPLVGVIDMVPPHILKAEDMEKAVPLDKLAIGTGLSQEELEKRCPPGTPAVFTGPVTELAGGWLCARALDDRSCAAVAVKAFEALSRETLGYDLILLISTQEEIGGRGAVVGAYGAAPDRAIVLDVTFAKQPDTTDVTVEAGKGPAVGIGPNMDRRMSRALLDLAAREGIPAQPEVLPGRSGTNAEEIQISREGTVTALVSLPIRYMHTPSETVKLTDMENTLRLVTAYGKKEE